MGHMTSVMFCIGNISATRNLWKCKLLTMSIGCIASFLVLKTVRKWFAVSSQRTSGNHVSPSIAGRALEYEVLDFLEQCQRFNTEHSVCTEI